jgi:hypothetical protein
MIEGMYGRVHIEKNLEAVIRKFEWIRRSAVNGRIKPAKVIEVLRELLSVLHVLDAKTDPRSGAEDSDGNTDEDHRAVAGLLEELGLKYPEDFSLSRIREAYRRLVKVHHPDKGGSADEFRRVSAAYAKLMRCVGK